MNQTGHFSHMEISDPFISRFLMVFSGFTKHLLFGMCIQAGVKLRFLGTL